MRNLVKVLGIIAMLAVIGLFVGCDVAPEDQTLITIAGLPASYDDSFAFVFIFTDTSDPAGSTEGQSKLPKIIRSGQAKEIPMYDDKGEAVIVKQGYVSLAISSDAKGEDIVYVGLTDKQISLGKGGYTVDADSFYPPIPSDVAPPAEKPAQNDFGTYETKYTSGSPAKDVTETIELTEGKFLIYDNDVGTTPTDRDFIDFKINKWEAASVPTEAAYATYTGAYKFTGKIIGAKGYIPANAQSKTAPGFVTADVSATEAGPDAWMYIYFKTNADNSITFIRTPFSKEGNENKGIVTGANNSPRVYTKK